MTTRLGRIGKPLIALLLTAGIALAAAPPASAGASTDAALALGAFAVFNQIATGQTVFQQWGRPAPVVVAPPPVVYAPAPAVVYAPPPVVYAPPPPPVYVYPRAVYVRPAPVF